MTAIIIIGVIVAIVLLALIIFVTMYNGLVRSRNRVKEAWSGIDVQLRRRASLVPNLVETVKGYASHERETFEEVTRARSAVEQAGTIPDAAAANNMLTGALRHLFAVAENYPELRASENFRDLQNELSDIEEKIAFSRQFYNTNVLDYNNRLQTVPTVFIANTFGFTREEFFEADEEGRAEVRVDFTGAAPSAAPGDETPETPAEQPGQQTS
jgi:LemA protein